MKKMFFYALALFFTLGFCGALLGAEEESYFALFMEGKKVGYAVISREVGDGKVKTVAATNITISRGQVSLSVPAV